MIKNFFLSEDNINNTGRIGFIETPHNVSFYQSMQHPLTVHGETLNRLSSVFPTPFARLYLFEYAFREINFYNTHLFPNVGTTAHLLVSQCLDLLEFIYLYAEDSRFGITEWDMNDECSKLNNSGDLQLKLLGKSLKSTFEEITPSLSHRIFLFTWDDVVLGGTSPYTLVYTSPNTMRILHERGLSFRGLNGEILFDDTKATPLYMRAEEFQQFIYNIYGGDSENTVPYAEFKEYIKNNNHYYKEQKQFAGFDTQRPGELQPLSVIGKDVETCGAKIYCFHEKVRPFKF